MQTNVNNTAIANREHWLIEAANMLENMVLLPALDALNETLPTPLKYSVSIGHTQSKNSIGECWRKAQSSDKETSQIFITPTINDSVRVLDILLHEMIHAADDCESGHKNFFARVARKCDLQGKFTATHAGDTLKETLLDIVDALGDIPHHKLTVGGTIKPKQKARMLKIECHVCEFTFRASRTQLERITRRNTSQCPCCGDDSLSLTVMDTLNAAQ